MPIELVICFRCDSCGVGLENRHVPGINTIPANGNLGIGALPPGWELTPDARIHCPEHPPRLVEVVPGIPHLPEVVKATHR